MNNVAFIVALVIIVSALVTSAGLTTVVTNKLVKRSEQLRKLTNDYEAQKMKEIATTDSIIKR